MKKSNELSAKLPQVERVSPKLNYEAPQIKVIMPTSSTKGGPNPAPFEIGTYGAGS
jgi:hypothetical protein